MDRYNLGNCAPLRIGGLFLAGCLLCKLYFQYPRVLQFGKKGPIGLTAAALILCQILPMGLESRMLIIPLFALLILNLAGDWQGAMLTSGWAILGGEISYSIYMTHGIVEYLGHIWFPIEAFANSPLPAKVAVIAGYAAALAAAAFATYYLVERPCRSVIRGRRQRSAEPVERILTPCG
jgi:peptidoglycan/LPS O-acetylase OafA/YrhL